MRRLVLIVLAACASAPPSHGSADEALAQTEPGPPETPHRNCAANAGGGTFAPGTGVLGLLVLPLVAAAATHDESACERAEHDRDAAAFQRARAAAAREDTPALVRRIEAAARAGDCATVRALEGALDDRDPEEHDRLYLHAAPIRRCMRR